MSSEKVSNEILYDLLKQQQESLHGLKDDIRDVKKDFRRLDDKFDRVDQRTRSLEDKLDSVRISWSTRLVSSILATSAVTSAIVAYAITSIL